MFMQIKTSTFSLKKKKERFSLSYGTSKQLGTVYVGKERMNVTGDEHNELVLLERNLPATFCNC